MNYAIVRSADTFVGGAWANALAGCGRHLILLGAQLDILEKTALSVREQYAVHVNFFVIDESCSEDIISVCGSINDQFEVDLLVNCHEPDHRKVFLHLDVYSLDRILKINFIATPLYIHQLQPNLSRFFNATVLNVNAVLSKSLTRQLAEAGVTLKNIDIDLLPGDHFASYQQKAAEIAAIISNSSAATLPLSADAVTL